RVYQATQRITVPWSDRDLQLEWATHRDKLLPGAAEEWLLTIKGSKKEAVAAELMAGLYDASLDALKPHNWHWNAFQYDNYLYSNWNANQGFGRSTGSTWLNHLRDTDRIQYVKQYDALDGLNALLYSSNPRIMLRGINGDSGASSHALSAAPAADAALEEVAVVGYGAREKKDLTMAAANETDAGEA